MSNDKRRELPNIKDTKLYKYYSHYLSKDDMQLYDEYFSQELPAALRLNAHCKGPSYISSLSKLILQYINKRKKGVLHPLPDCESAFTFNFSREQLKADPALNVIHKFLVLLNESGLVTRQEFVSMLPPLFLQCQKGEQVLDMCAAPGSKTSQLLEQVGPNGLVCANDVELQRCHVLMHGVIQQPTPQMVLTNLDATKWPSVVEFDRILCDVPCSGDGTLRKARDIAARWYPGHPASLHVVQLNILLRGLQLLRVGGTLCYSTCSLNVVEDEAVVNAALAICGMAIEVVDCSAMHSGINRSAGFTEWDIYDGEKAYRSFAEYQEAITSGRAGTKIKILQTMFPEYNGDIVYTQKQLNEPENSEIIKSSSNTKLTAETLKIRQQQLKHSMRFYPWQNNSGGFFVCLIQKKSKLPDHPHLRFLQKNALRLDKLNETHEKFNASLSKNIPLHPLRRLNNEEIRKSIESKYKLNKFFENNDTERILKNLAQRQLTDKNATNVYIFNDKVADIMYKSDYTHELLHVVQAGCTCFSRYSGTLGHEIGEKLKNAPEGERSSVGAYRMESSMIYLLENTDMTIQLTINCFKYLVQCSLGDDNKGNDVKSMESVTIDELREKGFIEDADLILQKKKGGILLLKIKISGQENLKLQEDFIDSLKVPVFLGGNSVSLHLKKKLRHALRCLLDNQDITEVIMSGQTIRKAEYRERKKQKAKQIQEDNNKKDNK